MYSERTRFRLADIIRNIDSIDEYMTGLSTAALAADRRTIDTIERCLQRITEAAIQIDTQDMSRIAPDLPIREIRSMGNMLRHDYRRIDLAIILNTIRQDLPELRSACVAALAD